MTAGDRFAGYRHDVPGAQGDGTVDNFATRSVLRELCRVAHDAGVAQVSVATIAGRLGVSERTVRRALARLARDGWVTRAVRGTGNRHGTQPRGSVYVIHQLPDSNGELWPHAEWLSLQWSVYVGTRRWTALDRANRQAVRDAWTGVDNSTPAGLLADSQGPTSGQPCPHSSQGDSQIGEVPATPVHVESPRIHPRAAARARGRFALVTGIPPTEGQR